MDSRVPQHYINFCISKVVVNHITISYYSSSHDWAGGGRRKSQQFTKHYQLIQGKPFPKRAKFPGSKPGVSREVKNREMQLMSLNRSKNCGAPQIMVSPKNFVSITYIGLFLLNPIHTRSIDPLTLPFPPECTSTLQAPIREGGILKSFGSFV